MHASTTPATGFAPANTSAQALHQISNGKRKTLCDMIVDVVTQAQRRGERDLSMREVQAALHQAYGRWVDVSTISARVNEMVGTRLQRTTAPRQCTISKAQVQALSVPLRQASLETRGYY